MGWRQFRQHKCKDVIHGFKYEVQTQHYYDGIFRDNKKRKKRETRIWVRLRADNADGRRRKFTGPKIIFFSTIKHTLSDRSADVDIVDLINFSIIGG